MQGVRTADFADGGLGPAPITASVTITSKPTWTSSPFGSTADAPRWPRSRPCWGSPRASMAPRPTTCCTVRSQPDRQNVAYALRSSRPLVRARVPGVSLRVAGLLHQPRPVGGRDLDARAGLGGVAAGELRVLDDGQLLDLRA